MTQRHTPWCAAVHDNPFDAAVRQEINLFKQPAMLCQQGEVNEFHLGTTDRSVAACIAGRAAYMISLTLAEYLPFPLAFA